MMVVILDGYIDEPSNLGVRPYISPIVRYVAGGAWRAGREDVDVTYVDIDSFRSSPAGKETVDSADVLAIIAGVTVPGKYMRGRPASSREVVDAARASRAEFKVLAGDMARFLPEHGIRGIIEDTFDVTCRNDGDAVINHYLESGAIGDCRRTREEWDRWAVAGAPIISQHPDFPRPLTVEVDLFKGCPRAGSGGCSFCTEPLRGKVERRDIRSVVEEMKALDGAGAVNYRLACSCVFCYEGDLLGDRPIPRPERVKELLEGVRVAAPRLEVLHVDNADPAVVVNNPEESRTILSLLVRYCTPGNALSFGIESADPAVHEKNNLNANPDEAMAAIAMVNEIGGGRGVNGMPMLLPGLNFLAGLPGETPRTFQLNLAFLKDILDSGHLLRRINIRQVSNVRGTIPAKASKAKRKDFMRFKKAVREGIDRTMLERMLPRGTLLRGLFLEKYDGNVTFGRQAGTYPILVGIPYKYEHQHAEPFDISITEWGFRSVTGVVHPMDINAVPMSWMTALPGIGKKRAARIVRSRPLASIEELAMVLDDWDLAVDISGYLVFGPGTIGSRLERERGP